MEKASPILYRNSYLGMIYGPNRRDTYSIPYAGQRNKKVNAKKESTLK